MDSTRQIKPENILVRFPQTADLDTLYTPVKIPSG